MIYDTAIIGGGPAGLTAAIYLGRAMLNTVVIEKQGFCGGQINLTDKIENYSGFKEIDGSELAEVMENQAKSFGTAFVYDTAIKILNGDIKTILLKNNMQIQAKTIIIATGAGHKSLNINGESEFLGAGVSYCAVCDGAFYKDKITAVIGGGDTAAKEALYLSRICKKVYLIHRRDKLRAAQRLVAEINKTDNIEFLKNSIPLKILGDKKVNQLVISHDGKEENLDCSGIFIAIGMTPETSDFIDIINTDENGYIISDEDGVTSSEGIFAAGDCRTKKLRQITTAVSDGANAVFSVQEFLNRL